MGLDIQFLGDDKILSLENGKKFILNDSSKVFIKEMANNSYENAVKSLSDFYKIDSKIIKEDFDSLYKQLTEPENEHIGGLPFRKYVVLEPTNDCDAHCIHCFHRNKDKYSWSINEIDHYINLLKKNAIKSISLTGGEIFSPHFIDKAKYLIKKLVENNISICTISTNGMFLTDELIAWLLAHINVNETIFRISVDTCDKDEVYSIRPGYKEYYNSNFWSLLNEHNFRVIVTTIISVQNEEEIKRIAEYLTEQQSVKKWILKPLVPVKKEQQKLIDWDRIKIIYMSILDWYKENDNKVKYDFIIGNVISKNVLEAKELSDGYDLLEHPCKNEMFQKTIKSNGKVTRCPMLSELSSKFQVDINFLESNTNELFDQLITREMQCNSCKYQKLCGGGCRAYAIAFFDNEKACDLNARMMYDWITNDTYFKEKWENYYNNIRRCIKNGD